MSGQTALFSKVSDTFHLFLTQEVQTGERIIKDITLQRIVGKIEFISADGVPKALKSFTINVSNYQNKIGLTTGNGISQNTPYTQTDTLTTLISGKQISPIPSSRLSRSGIHAQSTPLGQKSDK